MKTYLFNPFLKIAGYQAFLFGSLFVILSAILCFLFNGIFDGVIDFHITNEVNISQISFTLLIDITSLIVVFYPLGLLLNSGKVRFIDLLGTFTFARFPLLLLPLSNIYNIQGAIIEKLITNQANSTTLNLSIFEISFLIALSLFFIAIVIWYIVLLYKAYTVSANQKGQKAVISFIIGLILSEILSKILIVTFLK